MEPFRVEIPAHDHAIVPWRQSVRGGTAEDRRMSKVEVSLPPYISGLDSALSARLAAQMEGALRVITALDKEHGTHLNSLSVLLLRAESVASSKIERIEASMDDYARALHGSKSNASATSMVASTQALAALIESAGSEPAIAWDQIARAHEILMADDPDERAWAGRIRDMQNWIGGSDYSPRGALYVPPPPETVERYLDDLLDYANRRDVPVLLQAAVLHAQFESIHPFTDGNGRIGRALVNTILRRRGATSTIVVPLASALVARRDDYFDVLGAYRKGDAGPITSAFTAAAHIAAEESATSSHRIAAMPALWAQAAGSPRADSAAARMIARLADAPIFSAEEAAASLGGSSSSVYAAIDRLHNAGVVRQLTQRSKNQVWGASDLLVELDDLSMRIASRARVEM